MKKLSFMRCLPPICLFVGFAFVVFSEYYGDRSFLDNQEKENKVIVSDTIKTNHIDTIPFFSEHIMAMDCSDTNCVIEYMICSMIRIHCSLEQMAELQNTLYMKTSETMFGDTVFLITNRFEDTTEMIKIQY